MSKEIIIVVEHFTTGGAERVLSELVSEWCKNGHKVCAVQIRPKKFSDSYKLPENLELIDLHASSNRFIRRFQNTFELVKLLNKRPNAVVISFVEPAMLVVAMASFFIKNKIIFSERCDPKNNPPKKIMRVVRDIIFNVPDVCVFQTEEARNYFSKSIQNKGTVIPNPINPDLPEPYLGKRRNAIAYVGRFVPQKNIPMLLDAYEKLVKEYPQYILEMYGRGQDEEEIISLIKQKKLEDEVVLKGFQLDVINMIKDCQMYVSSSDYEGISNSMLEALAMGIPTVVTDCPVGGARQMIQNGVNGLLVPVGDSDALYGAMKSIIENESDAQRMSESAVKIRELYPADRVADKWIMLM